VSREASQHRLASEEARGAKTALQSQLDEANASVRQLQALVGQYSGGSKGVSCSHNHACMTLLASCSLRDMHILKCCLLGRSAGG
jgi:hypothetical protein